LSKNARPKSEKNLQGLFEEHIFSQGTNLTLEGDEGAYFYILDRGECQLFKETSPTISPGKLSKNKGHELSMGRKDKILIKSLTSASFIGEEILFNGIGLYDYTCKVVSLTAKIFRINKMKFILTVSHESLQRVKEIYQEKENGNKIFEDENKENIPQAQPKYSIISPKYAEEKKFFLPVLRQFSPDASRLIKIKELAKNTISCRGPSNEKKETLPKIGMTSSKSHMKIIDTFTFTFGERMKTYKSVRQIASPKYAILHTE